MNSRALFIIFMIAVCILTVVDCGGDDKGDNIVLHGGWGGSMVLSSGKKKGDNIVIKDGHECECDEWDDWAR